MRRGRSAPVQGVSRVRVPNAPPTISALALTVKAPRMNPRRTSFDSRGRNQPGSVAQTVEHEPEKLGVAGSTPARSTRRGRGPAVRRRARIAATRVRFPPTPPDCPARWTGPCPPKAGRTTFESSAGRPLRRFPRHPQRPGNRNACMCTHFRIHENAPPGGSGLRVAIPDDDVRLVGGAPADTTSHARVARRSSVPLTSGRPVVRLHPRAPAMRSSHFVTVTSTERTPTLDRTCPGERRKDVSPSVTPLEREAPFRPRPGSPTGRGRGLRSRVCVGSTPTPGTRSKTSNRKEGS